MFSVNNSTDLDAKLDVRAFYLCEDAIQVFVNGMPDIMEISDHRINMDNLTYLSKDEIKYRIGKYIIFRYDLYVFLSIYFLGKLAEGTGGSVTVEGCSAIIMADTTFNLIGDMCVTFIVGMLSKFRYRIKCCISKSCLQHLSILQNSSIWEGPTAHSGIHCSFEQKRR